MQQIRYAKRRSYRKLKPSNLPTDNQNDDCGEYNRTMNREIIGRIMNTLFVAVTPQTWLVQITHVKFKMILSKINVPNSLMPDQNQRITF